jgi:hypothetical protein
MQISRISSSDSMRSLYPFPVNIPAPNFEDLSVPFFINPDHSQIPVSD